MKIFPRLLLVYAAITALICLGCYCSKAQVPASPTYVGALDGNVYIPAVFKGKNYKISGDRFGGGSIIVGDTFSDQPATVEIQSGLGALDVTVGKNGYGMVKYINTTGGLYGGVEIRVNYSATMPHKPIPVICDYKSSGSSLAPFLLLNADEGGFIVRFTDSIINGASTSFTYNVKGF